MKVIIAYDGSTYADAAIDDLSRAGFPRDSEVLVASVADFSAHGPAFSEFDLLSAASRRMDAVLERMRHHEEIVVKETRVMASKIEHLLRLSFPGWRAYSEVLRGKPVDELLLKADEWKADLIMGGSQGRSAIGRFLLGSVSKSLAEEAACSVRIVRRGFEKADNEPIEILLGAKNPAEAERIVEAVDRRVWPADTRIRLVAADDGVSAGRVSAFYSDGKTIYQCAGESLEASGLKVSVQIHSGDPKTIFLEAADAWRADAIFVVASSTDSPRLDATASGLVTTAHCTVEVVR